METIATKKMPATPLPWVTESDDSYTAISGTGPLNVVRTNASKRNLADAAYIAHAANAYPRLVEALQSACAAYGLQATRDGADSTMRAGWTNLYNQANALLRELGEDA